MTRYPDNRAGVQRGNRPGPSEGGGPERESFQATPPDLLRKIITDPNAAEDLVKEAARIGKKIAETLSTSQIRAIFGEVRSIEGDWQHDPQRAHRRLILLKPKMDYRAKKESGRGVEYLVQVLKPAVDYVQGKTENFERFVEFFEAILAYHRAYGGR